MADENQTPNENAQNAEAQQAQPSFQMVRSYLKDASLGKWWCAVRSP